MRDVELENTSFHHSWLIYLNRPKFVTNLHLLKVELRCKLPVARKIALSDRALIKLRPEQHLVDRIIHTNFFMKVSLTILRPEVTTIFY